MAIRTPYVAPDKVIRPEAEGFAAYETMGRRVGVDYNEAGTAYRRIGELQAQAIKGRAWPFDILELEAAQERAQRAQRGGGGGVRLRGGGGGSAADPLGFYNNRSYDVHDQISSGMAALGDALGSTYTPISGTQLVTDGGELVDLTSGTTTVGRKSGAGFGGGGELIDISGGTTTLGRQTAPGTHGSFASGGNVIDIGGPSIGRIYSPNEASGAVLPQNSIVSEELPGSVASSYDAPYSGYQAVPGKGYQAMPASPNYNPPPYDSSGFYSSAQQGGFLSGLGDWLSQFGASAEVTSGFE